MAELKTQATEVDPADFIASVEPAGKRSDAEVLYGIFRRATGVAPYMWGASIVGYGSYHYRYASGHQGDAPRVGFSPRKAKHSLYLLGCGGEGADARFEEYLTRLGKHSRAVACLYVNKLADIDLTVLEEMVELSWNQSFKDWPES